MPLLKKDLPDIQLDAGMYSQARQLGMSMTDYLAQLESDKGYEPKGDAAELDAFERQLAKHDISPQGASLVQDFFKTSTSAVLFPEYVQRQVSLGMLWGKREVSIEDLIAATDTLVGTDVTRIPGLDFSAEKAKASKVSEGSRFPVATIKFKDKTVQLGKVGVAFQSSYEAIRRVKLPIINIMLQRIGYNIKNQITELALKVMKDGDGSAGSAATTSTTTTTTWTYADYVDAIMSAADGHEYSHICLAKAFMQKMLTDATNFPQFQSRSILEAFLKTGDLTDFLGVKWRTHAKADDNTILSWEQSSSLISYEEAGANLVETDKFINKQMHESVISKMIGFGKPFEACAGYKTKKT